MFFALATTFQPRQRRIRPMRRDPMAALARIKVNSELTPEEEIAVKAAIEVAMSKVDDALAVVVAMVEEIEIRKEKARGSAPTH